MTPKASAGPINGTCPTGDEHRRHHGEARGRLHDRHGDALRRHVLMWLQGYEIGFAGICRPCASKLRKAPIKSPRNGSHRLWEERKRQDMEKLNATLNRVDVTRNRTEGERTRRPSQ